MKFLTHYIFTVFLGFLIAVIFGALSGVLIGIEMGILVGLAHFVPSVDWALKRMDFKHHFHRGLFHNIFFALIVGLFFYYFFGTLVGILAMVSILLHILMDMTVEGHKGVAIFFPFSTSRYAIPIFTDSFESVLDSVSIIGTILICLYLVI